MITEKCYTKEWIDSFKKKKGYKKLSPPMLEKMIWALSLLYHLKNEELDFVFKGGTALIILLENPKRISIDIDILTTTSREEIEKTLDNVIQDSSFDKWVLDERRSYKEGIPKAHYILDYPSNFNKKFGGNVLLDILFEENTYSSTIELPIKSEWIEINNDIKVSVPVIDAILGDKLTAFAPNTTGILYNKNKETEIVKQLFDIGCLVDEANDIEIVYHNFTAIAKKEISYRNLTITPNDILDDIIVTSLLIAKRERNVEEPEKSNFTEIKSGLEKLTHSLYKEPYQIENAISSSAKAAYIAAKLKARDFSPIKRFNKEEIKTLEIVGEFNFLNKLKKQDDLSAFYYWYHTLSYIEQ